MTVARATDRRRGERTELETQVRTPQLAYHDAVLDVDSGDDEGSPDAAED
jgi:hypothetical protein